VVTRNARQFGATIATRSLDLAMARSIPLSAHRGRRESLSHIRIQNLQHEELNDPQVEIR
jgi:hypothetical protein